MSSTALNNLIRIGILVLVQILLLQQMELRVSDTVYIHWFVYPLGILLLPVRTPDVSAMLIGFAVGLIIDLFYGTPGVHAAALVFTAFVRRIALRFHEPRDGYAVNASPVPGTLGKRRFFWYLSVTVLLHCFWYFFMEAFTLWYIGKLLLNAGINAIVSVVIMYLVMVFSNPKE